MALLHMKKSDPLLELDLDFLRFPTHKNVKIFDLLLEPDLDFLRFPKHETGWGVRYPGQGIFTPTLYSWHAMWYCYLDQ